MFLRILSVHKLAATFLVRLLGFFGFVFVCRIEGNRTFVATNCLQQALCADTSASRRKHILVGSAKTSLFWKLAAASTPVGKA